MDETNPTAELRTPNHPVRRLRLLVSWLWVGIPLGWGVWQTVMKSLPLFTSVGRL